MSAISMFHDIIIRMPETPRADESPYFTASYNEFDAQVDIARAEVVTGNLPAKQARLVEGWAELRRDKLMANWNLLKRNGESFNIEPLR